MQIISAKPINNKKEKGRIPKHWYTLNNEPTEYLVKGNSKGTVGSVGTVGYQPYSEVIASNIAQFLGIPHVPYFLADASMFPLVKTYGIQHVSVCPKVGLKGYRLQTLYDYGNANGVKKNVEVIEFMEKRGMDLTLLYKMLIFDALLGNPDRHADNIELFVPDNAIGQVHLAPIIDNGESLLGGLPPLQLPLAGKPFLLDKAKPFYKRHKKQIQLVPENFLKGLDKESLYTNLLMCVEPLRPYLPPYRHHAICQYLKWRIYYLEQVMEVE